MYGGQATIKAPQLSSTADFINSRSCLELPSTVVADRYLCLQCDDLRAYHFTHYY